MAGVGLMTQDEARRNREVLLEQERILRYRGHFGAYDALELGRAAIDMIDDYECGYTITITRERDGVVMFQWVDDAKGERNLAFAEGKRRSALEAGHASPWAELDAAERGMDVEGYVFADVPRRVPACGAFPLRVGDDWVATIAVSGLMDGLDHEVIVRALERVLGVEAPRFASGVM